MAAVPSYKLTNGVSYPCIGLGTYAITGRSCVCHYGPVLCAVSSYCYQSVVPEKYFSTIWDYLKISHIYQHSVH